MGKTLPHTIEGRVLALELQQRQTALDVGETQEGLHAIAEQLQRNSSKVTDELHLQASKVSVISERVELLTKAVDKATVELRAQATELGKLTGAVTRAAKTISWVVGIAIPLAGWPAIRRGVLDVMNYVFGVAS